MHKQGKLDVLVLKYMAQSGAEAKQTLEEILAQPDAILNIYGMIQSENRRAALKTLADIAKKKQGKEILMPLVIRDADMLIAIPDDKARKSAYKLIGLCAPDTCADKLSAALENEKTRYVRPSIILALGNSADPARYLGSYMIEPGEQKHLEQEKQALKKALDKTMTQKSGLSPKWPEFCLLTYTKREALALELAASRCAYEFKEGLFEVRAEKARNLRCYLDMLFEIGAEDDYAAAAKMLDDMGCRGYSYRIETGSLAPPKRLSAIRALSAGLEKHGYTDNPSAYAFELRFWKGRLCAVFEDSRFAYRKESIAASINPVTAASIMRMSAPYMREGADVLDPFCGSGTMLIERAFLMHASTLTGVDISARAIKAACTNRRASGMRISLLQKDILSFDAAQYDEVIANMPFGIRVLAHSDNLKLYSAFLKRLPGLLKKGGYAFLLTQEKKLMRSVIDSTPSLKIIAEEDFESGGLCPRLYIIKKEQTV